ncbi:hypothetical protein [Klebsiella michiganensis]|uniref:hypothetical protein n=1 Tax=Klebsiella michiganensis TaxID=1134687 RepID=UPI00026BBACA|nr:hypothetical protein [Klebsiella michiganensis]CAH6304251.1 hypothetical protein AN2336V5_4361 [Klebsiella oxytoca]AFN31213.1 hypothetical protein A225_1460 [Klebsiella michiganensis E718]ASK76109.1 hypothetical protein CF000_25005 [Klebsiella michiganensis]ASZ54697.1 hypothetical protein CKQ55_05220 [Klebsiella michiganensis]MBG2660234.1 hypothetical protein [Klebsiella michiganensis]
MPLLWRETTELTIQEIPKLNGEVLDNHTHYTIRNGLAQALEAKERHRRRMNVPAYRWKNPAASRR